jgi:hypothetical protein
MSRDAGRIVSTGLLAAVAALVWLTLMYGVHSTVSVDFATAPARLLTGVYPVEVDPEGRAFAWTSDQATLRLPGLDRRVGWRLTVRVRGARLQDNPELTFAADGVVLETRPTTTAYSDIETILPARPDRRGATITITSSNTFVPGPGDRRRLGVVLSDVHLSAIGIVVPPRSAFGGAAVAAGAMGGSIAALGITAGSSIGAAIVIAAGIAAAVSHGFGPYTDFPGIAARAGIAIALALALAAIGARLVSGGPLRNTARFVLAFSSAAALLKLLVLLHPDMPIGDTLFQAHRFQEVLAGHLFFTSIAPGNYLFPYAPGLYVISSLFSGLVARGLADMALLRVVTVTTDAIAGALLYGLVARARGDRVAGACAVALYHLLPLDFGVLSTGNLTNAFAQSLSVIALAMMGGAALTLHRRFVLAAFVVVATAAFLSHTSTFAILSAACLLTAVLFWWRGGVALRPSAMAILTGVAIAILLAVGLYYAHFVETFRTQLARIGGETAAAAPDAGGRGIMARLFAVPRYVYLYFGVPGALLAAWGIVASWRQGRTDRLTLSLQGWALACLVFLVIGIVTPVDMRYYLAAIPVIAIAGGIGASAAWSAGGPLRGLCAAVLMWALVAGVRGWWSAIA